jgi:tRNA(Ile)-lysidine synthase
MLLAQAVLPGRFAVATIDHGLRAQGAEEAAMVGAICSQHSIPHSVVQLGLSSGSGVQERARHARYAALGDWLMAKGLGALVTAHHSDDQAETLLMRLTRGSGVRGLASMRPIAAVPGRTAFPLLRPLLGWRRFELGEIVAEAGIMPAIDPSNGDTRFERVRMRAAMAASDWLDIPALVRSTLHLAEADVALDWAANRAFAEVQSEGDALAWEPDTIPRALGMRVLERIVMMLGRAEPRGAELARWFDALSRGRIATLAGVRGDGTDRVWIFSRARPPSSQPRR